MTFLRKKERVIILGCGSSTGTPRIGEDWGSCDPKNPKNRRLRSSILYEKIAQNGEKTTILIDTSPDLRTQLLEARVQHIDAVFFTHDHADQTHGIDDLRALFLKKGGYKRISTFMSQETSTTMEQRFAYLFKKPEGSFYPPILDKIIIKPHETVKVDGAGGTVNIKGFSVKHGTINAYGFQIGDSLSQSVAYSPDVSEIAEEDLKKLEGVGCWIVDALRREPHPSHAHLDKSLMWLKQTNAMGILTNMHIHMDYETLSQELSSHIRPAYDGMEITRTEEGFSIT